MKSIKSLSYIFLILYAAFMAKALGAFLGDFSDLFPEFPSKIYAVATTLFLICSLVFVGQLTTQHTGKHPLFTPAQPASLVWKLLIWGALGAGIISTVIMLWGWAVPGSLKVKLSLLKGSLIVVFIYGCYANRRRIPSFFRFHPLSLGILEAVLLFITSVSILFTFIACFSPITYYDSLVYHLGLPALYLLNDRISAIPFNLYSLFPANVEMLFLLVLGTFARPEYIINLLCWMFALGTGIGIGQYVKETEGGTTGALAGFLWWTMPAVIFLSIGAYIDVALCFFVFLAVRSLLFAKEHEWEGKWIFISGLFSGLACATKYTGGMCIITIALVLLWSRFADRNRPAPNLFLFIMAALIPIAPWLIKNTLEVGNPIFPFGYQIFKGNVGWTEATAAGYFRILTQYGQESDLLKGLFHAPWKMVTQPMKFGAGFDVLGDFGWPLIILTAPLALFARPKRLEHKTILVLFFAFFLFWFFSKPVLRFLMPALSLGVILASLTILCFISHRKKAVVLITLVLTTPWLVANFFFVSQITDELQLLSVPLGFENQRQFLYRKLTFYPTYDFANINCPPGSKIFVFGEQRGYHLRIPYVAANLFAENPLARVCNREDLEKIGTFFHQHKITHILINQNELDRLGGPNAFGFTKTGETSLLKFLKTNTAPVFTRNKVDLFHIHRYHASEFD